ncbi:MAG: lytic transglycosylase domain-containing protein [Flavobacteriales bacterium]|jgi:membrane-bound lytic murein transglycosylase D|nr:lytic transglycosylase domain-containing protein [Flavobacteriales bacterium]
MIRKVVVLLVVISVIFLSQFFIFSSYLNTSDNVHQQGFNNKYKVYSIVKPNNLKFANEDVPESSLDIWERLDKELLKNIYWQSNTMLYFKRANKYFPIIEEILAKNNIPNDFKYLALIESGFENQVSPSGAAGFWQIMKGTAKEYGLEVNNAIDERYHLVKSTEVACEYLQKAYDEFGSWTMAAASYNMGINGARRKMLKQETNNYFNLHLNDETSRYVFRIIVIKEIMENPKKYGFVFRNSDLYKFPQVNQVRVDSTINDLYFFAKNNKINYKTLKKYNPWLRTSSLPDKSRRIYYIDIPTNLDLLVFDDIDESERFK